ncbi:S9 family peptidase [Saprospiraceae bacterium]|nr:S9 family peptidase [Saprospiraceae bacterium]
MKVNVLLIMLVLLLSNNVHAQDAKSQTITLEDIWTNYTFFANSVPGFSFLKDGKHYTRLEEGIIKQYDLVTGDFTKEVMQGNDMSSYNFSKDESLILFKTISEQIYRRSSKARYFVYYRASGETKEVFEDGLISNAQFSPDGTKVAFVYKNDLYFKDMSTDAISQISKDGKQNAIINGMADWVYEEEFGFTRAFEWNADGTKIAYIRFDETEVKEFTMTNYTNGLYPEYQTFKYPKVGEKNAEVSVHVFDINSSTIFDINLSPQIEYIPRIVWTEEPRDLVVFTMNRLQNKLQLLKVDTKTKSTSTILNEESKYYVDIHDNMTFVKGGKSFIWTSEKDGYNHIYLYSINGQEIRQITKGEYDVTNFYGYDEQNDQVFYQAAKKSPTNREIYSVNLKGKREKCLADKAGTNHAQFSSTFDYYVLNHSSINTPANYTVYNRKGKVLRNIVDNAKVSELMKTYGVSEVEFIQIPTEDNVLLNAYVIKPRNFDPNKEYPLFMYVYGGPGSQTATNSWKGQNYWWFQSLAQQDYIIVSVDNRGTGARGELFKKMTYKELGKYEIQDQINAAKYLGAKPYIDSKRIGIFGWSYGGYMSSLAITKGADVFKAAIAVAPVTNWKWYDTIYTERYMQTDRENDRGYEDNSPVNFADLLKGNYLLVHGNSDDNVHFQHSAEMANALIKANKQFDTYFYPNRNHSIYGDNARIHLYTKMNDFVLNKL